MPKVKRFFLSIFLELSLSLSGMSAFAPSQKMEMVQCSPSVKQPVKYRTVALPRRSRRCRRHRLQRRLPTPPAFRLLHSILKMSK